MFLKIICYVLFLSSIEFIDTVFQKCEYVILRHGRVRYQNRLGKVKFSCFKPLTLIGNSRLDCVDGNWSAPLPVCASKGCERIQNIHHGTVIYSNNGAVAKLQCVTNFTLISSSNIVICEPSRQNSPPHWNYTEIPKCQANSIRQFETCDFEPDHANQCKWILKSGLFNWTLMTPNPKNNPYMPFDGYPPYDHTLEQIHAGHFLYLEALFTRTNMLMDMMNTKRAPARFTSPLFPPIVDDEPHCLIFYLYKNGSHPSIVEVLVNERRIWKSEGGIGTEWHKIRIPLLKESTPFHITIEGKGELGKFSRTAIDDLRIAIGEECLESHQTEEDVHVTQTSIHAVETTTMRTTNNPITSTITIQNLETDQTTQQTDQITYTTQPPESKVVIIETIPPRLQSLKNHTNLASGNQIPAADDTEVLRNASTGFNLADNTAPTNHKTSNAIKNYTKAEVFSSSSKIDYTLIPSRGEILITENNFTYHDPDESKTNNIIVEDVPLNSTFYHKTATELRVNESTTKESSIEQKIHKKSVNQTLNKQLASFVHSILKVLDDKVYISVLNTSPLTPISNDTVVESNNAKYKYDHEKETSQRSVNEETNNLRHSGTERTDGIISLKADENENDKIKASSSNLNQSSNSIDADGRVIGIISLFVICATLLFIIDVYRKSYCRNRREYKNLLFFTKKDPNNVESPHKKYVILKLNSIPKKTT